MLTLFARHGRFDLDVTCHGDVDVDDHHSVEDIGICLGMAFAEALGNGAGIRRYGHIILPMDETLILCAVDPVSYTHLDVYKRQMQQALEQQNPVSQLLYVPAICRCRNRFPCR